MFVPHFPFPMSVSLGSRLALSLVLNTAVLSEAQRTAYGLRAGDTATASDHLPVVVDRTVD